MDGLGTDKTWISSDRRCMQPITIGFVRRGFLDRRMKGSCVVDGTVQSRAEHYYSSQIVSVSVSMIESE